jgi:hypothetical protein
MKNQVILLLSSLVIIFLVGYFESVTDEYYPVSGSFGISGEKVSYKMDKIHFGESPIEVKIISDEPNLDGYIKWKKNGNWQFSKMKYENNLLSGTINAQTPVSEIEYQVVLTKDEKEYIIPENQTVHLTIFGKIPPFVSTLYDLLLYVGLFLSIRTALEVFNDDKFLKKYSFVQSAIFLLLAILISPLYVSYKLSAINHTVLPIMTIFDLRITLLALISILSSVLVFNIKNKKYITLMFSVLMILIFIVLR